MVRGLFPHHNRRAIQVAVGDPRKDRAVGKPQPVNPDHPTGRINHRCRIIRRPHTRGAAGVKGALDIVADELVQLVIGLQRRARLDFFARIGFERSVISEAQGVLRCSKRVTVSPVAAGFSLTAIVLLQPG